MIKDKSRPRTIYIYSLKFISFDAVTALTEIYPNETRTDMCNDLLQGGSGDKGGKLKKKNNTNRRSKSQIHTQQQLNKLYTLKQHRVINYHVLEKYLMMWEDDDYIMSSREGRA